MKEIKFSREQFAALLKLVYLGNWVINSDNVSDEIETEYENLEEFLFKQTKLFNLEEFSHEEIPEMPSDDIETELQEIIEEYNDRTFWNELKSRLAIKKALMIYSKEELYNMDPYKRLMILDSIENDLDDEFVKNGLDNIEMKLDILVPSF